MNFEHITVRELLSIYILFIRSISELVLCVICEVILLPMDIYALRPITVEAKITSVNT